MRIVITGTGIENAELLPPTGYTPIYATFTVSPDKKTASLDLDTRTIPNRPLEVRVSAFNVPAGQPNAREIIAMSSRLWQINNSTAPTAPTAPEPTPAVIESYIVGTFGGWKGNTVVQLSNGQVWRQIDFQQSAAALAMPKVTVTQIEGMYFMIVKGSDLRVAVQRLQ